MNAPARSHDPLIGTLVDDRYRIDHALAEGGMGVVYAGHHETMMRPIALKVMKPQWSTDERAVARFLREAQLAGSLGHPNVVEVWDVGRLPDSRPYLVMPRLQGLELLELVAEHGAVSPRRAAALLEGVADALDTMHRRGLVHRDIKLENLIVIRDHAGHETVKILDFGLAALMDPSAKRLTREGIICGTPEYLPPEAAAGRLVDARGDVYSLGVAAFELMTRNVPFDGTPLQILQDKSLRDAPKLSECCETEFSPEIEAVVARALSRVPEERYPVATEFVGDLRRAAEKQVELEGVRGASGRAPGRKTEPLAWFDDPPPAKSGESLRSGVDDDGTDTLDDELDATTQSDSVPSQDETTVPAGRVRASAAAGERLKPMGALEQAPVAVRPARRTHRGWWVGLLILLACVGAGVGVWELTEQRADQGLRSVSGQDLASAQLPTHDAPLPSTSEGDAPSTADDVDADRTLAVAAGAAMAAVTATEPSPTPRPVQRSATREEPPSPARSAGAEPAASEAPAGDTTRPGSTGAGSAGSGTTGAGSAESGSTGAGASGPTGSEATGSTSTQRPTADDPNVSLPSRDPDAAASSTRAGTAALIQGQLPGALAHFRRAVLADPSHAPAWRGIGLANERLGRTPEAVDAYRRYLRLASGASDAPAIRRRLAALAP